MLAFFFFRGLKSGIGGFDSVKLELAPPCDLALKAD